MKVVHSRRYENPASLPDFKVVCHFGFVTDVLLVYPQHPIIIGKKKYRDIQFYTEVS